MLGWLHAVPRPDPESARGKSEAAGKNTLSRLELMKRDGITPRMPPNPAPHIINRLAEMGFVQPGGFGPSVLSWTEIVAWQAATMERLAPWEARLLRRLSAAYLAENREAESENRPAPWYDGPDARMVETEQVRLIAVLG